MDAVFIAIGTIIGVLLGWFLASLRAKSVEGRLEIELRQQISNKDAEITAMRARETQLIAEKSAGIVARELSEQQLAELQLDKTKTEEKINDLREELRVQSNALSTSQADLKAARDILSKEQALYEKQLKENKEAQEKAILELREAFRALSVDVLNQNAPEFLRLANASFEKIHEAAKGDLDKRQESIAGLLQPLNEQLRNYQQRLQQSESTQSTAIGEVKKQLETLTNQTITLANETGLFRNVLKSSQARGRWGEETLRRVVEAAGMSAHCDFDVQTKEAESKPDMIVYLPGGRTIIVDAKAPDLEFLTALDTADTQQRTDYLRDHARKLKETIRVLADRNYASQFQNSLDYIVLFLPAESLFSAALEGDRDLLIWAANKKIMLATPASLIGLLRCISISWQQFAQTENTRSILNAAQELYGRVATFTEHFEKIRAGLVRANEAFSSAVNSYDRMVRPSGERLLKLGLTGGKELTDMQPLENALRLPVNNE